MTTTTIVNRIFHAGHTELIVEHSSPEIVDREKADRLHQALEVFGGYWTPEACKAIVSPRTERRSCAKKARRHSRESIRFISVD